MADPTNRCVILLDGEMTPTPRLRHQVAGARVIAADGGMRHAGPLDLEPDLWVGDFDSTHQAQRAAHAHVPREDHPAKKAVSDGELAVEKAIAGGAKALILCGALGGARTDHMLFHLLLAIRLATRNDLDVLLTSGREEAVPLLPGVPLRPDLPAGTLFSVIPFSPLSGLSIDNAEWPLDRIEVAMGGSHTLSNRAGHGVTIALGRGTAAVVSAFDV